jgi:zinc protease
MMKKILFFAFWVIASEAMAALPIQHWQTTNGAKVYFIQGPALGILDVSVTFPAGASFDSAAKSGAARLTQALLKHGSSALNEDEIAEKLANVGAIVSDQFDLDRAGLSLRTLSSPDERAQALSVFSQMLQSPQFDDKVLEREKTNLISALKQADTRPEETVQRTFFTMLYGTHSYALRPDGEVATVQKLEAQDLREFYSAHYAADQAVVAIVSDITKEDAATIAESLTLALGASPHHAAAPEPSPVRSSETKSIAHPASQSHVLIGTIGMRRGDPDYFPLYVGNHILGGSGFGSRLVENVREKQGLAYSAYSYFIPYKNKGPFIIGFQTKKEQTQQALDIVMSTLHDFLATGPTKKELHDAKNNIIGGFPLRFDSNKELLEYLSVIGFYDLPLRYLDEFVQNVEKVSLDDIRNAFRRRIDANKLITVIVGAPS